MVYMCVYMVCDCVWCVCMMGVHVYGCACWYSLYVCVVCVHVHGVCVSLCMVHVHGVCVSMVCMCVCTPGPAQYEMNTVEPERQRFPFHPPLPSAASCLIHTKLKGHLC